MKIFLSLILLLSGNAFGKPIQKSPIRENGTAKGYPIDGTPLLQKQYQQAAEYVASHPDMMEKMKLEKTEAWNFAVGDTHTWWAANLTNPSKEIYYQDASICKAVGKHCYIFVEDSMWTSGRVTQAAVDSIENDFDDETPANPNEGIFVMDTSAFGAPPNVQPSSVGNDPKIIILILNIQDGYTGTGGYVAGFFDPNQEVPLSNSNETEIYYIDANPTDLTQPSGIQLAMQTCAHEFQHMINWNYNNTKPGGELTFINEGCSKLAEVYCGYPTFDLSLYANETNIYLFTWRTNNSTLVLNDYSRAQRFFLYIWDRFGIGIFKHIVQSTQISGTDILNDALSKDGLSPLTFNNIFSDWLIANELDDTTATPANRLYGYAYPGLPASNGKNFYNPNVSGTDTVQNIGAEYLIFTGGSNLNITFTNTGGNSNLAVEAIEMGNSSENVVPVSLNTPFPVPGYGTTYNTIAFVAINKDSNNSATYSYQASGTAPVGATELKWDNTEPTGYYAWAPSDTVCVTFNAYPGGTLDSIHVALDTVGSITGGVYQFTGALYTTPLGEKLATISATLSTSSYTSNNYWTNVTVTSNNISTDEAFAVAFVVGSGPSVMATDYPGQNPYHSYTYLTATEASEGTSPSPAGWYYISDSDTTISIYLIRAYVSIVTGVKQTAELTPTGFNLSQNYPNPFNPTTVISYQLSSTSNVTLTVFDVLGREIKTLVNARLSAGKHNVTFDASGLSSGVYFYKLSAESLGQAGSNVAVKKLVLLK
jgi:hypothetical protein